jgi:hypothetical protein
MRKSPCAYVDFFFEFFNLNFCHVERGKGRGKERKTYFWSCRYCIRFGSS